MSLTQKILVRTKAFGKRPFAMIRKNKKVIDILLPNSPAIVVCIEHLRCWRESDLFIENGGKACKECLVSKKK